MNKLIPALMILALAGCNTAGKQDHTESGPGKKNILFILADDCTNWDIGCYGSKDAVTPNIDRLASQGMKFERCYQAAPMCSPTRHNIYTGLYPVKTGAYPNHTMVKPDTRCILNGSEHYGIRSVVGSRYRYIWNLTPEVYWQSWLNAAKTDTRADELVQAYSFRPEEELRTELLAWMEECGDKGAATEIEAL